MNYIGTLDATQPAVKVDSNTVASVGVGALLGGLTTQVAGKTVGLTGNGGRMAGLALGALGGFILDQRNKKKAQ